MQVVVTSRAESSRSHAGMPKGRRAHNARTRVVEEAEALSGERAGQALVQDLAEDHAVDALHLGALLPHGDAPRLRFWW